MATWCFLSGMIRRLKSGQKLLDASVKSHVCEQAHRRWRGQVISLSKTCCYAHSACVFSRFLHTSDRYHGKKLPSGVPQKRKALKTSKGFKLDRVYVHQDMTVSEIALAMKKPIDHVYEVLLMVPGSEEYDHDDAVLERDTIVSIVKRSGMIPEFVTRKKPKEEKDGDIDRQPPPDPSVLVKRPPVVTIMGHVDHGKTTLLDKLRLSNIVDQEFGGITQHIGAFLVKLKSGESICFLDTPGHAAFSAMRSRGAHLTDVIVLVVAADDGVMQQTLESIHHAQDAGVPIIVAINKIDKHNADLGRTKQMLLEHQIQLEEFGGEVQAVPISALKGTNLAELQDAIVTQAELMNLQADPVGLVEGRVVEARVDDKRGRLVTAVIQRGTLQRGDFLIAGTAWGKVRAMFDDTGNPVQKAPPGTPVEILGWKEMPAAGEEILQVKKESELKSVLAWRRKQQLVKKQEQDAVAIEEKRDEHFKEYKAAELERRQKGFFRSRRSGNRLKEVTDESDQPQYAIVLKGDVDGSVDAILDALDTYNSKKCELDVIHFGVGSVTESDVEMAATFEGDLYAFNVLVPEKVKTLANAKGVRIRRHNIIYRLFEDLISGLNSKLPKIQEDVTIGEAKVLQVFQVTLPNKKKSYVAGCRCIQGSISKKFGIKVMRDEETIYKGNIITLKHYRDDVDTIKKEQECGICVDDEDFIFQPQDIIVCFEVKDIDQEIDWDPGF